MSEAPAISRRALVLWVLALALAYAAPRLVLWRGLEYAPRLEFLDMNRHQVNVDLVDKARRLGPQAMADPYLVQNPAVAEPVHALRWPPGVYWLASLWSGALGPLSIWTVQLVNLVFSIVLTVGLVILGRDLLGSLRLGLWGALLALLSPCLFAASYYLTLDYPLAAMVVVGLLLLQRGAGFTRPGYTAALALWSVLGVLVKLTYPAYLLVPSLAALAVTLRRGPGRARVAALALAAAASAAVLLLGFLLLDVDVGELGRELSAHLVDERPNEFFEGELLRPWSVRWLLSVPLFALNSFPWPLLLLLLPGLVLAHHPRRPLPGRWLLLAYGWGIALMVTLLANKMERYLLPLYPVLCLAGVWGMAQIPARRWRRGALAGSAVAFAVVLAVAQHWPTPWWVDEQSHAPAEDYMYDLRMPGIGSLDGVRRYRHHYYCQLGGLFRQADAMLRADRSRRPLMVALLWEDGAPGSIIFREREVYWPLRTYLAHAQRDRLVLEPFDRPQMDPPDMESLRAPRVLILHAAEAPPEAAYPGALRLLQRRQATVRCDGFGEAAGTLSLYEPSGP